MMEEMKDGVDLIQDASMVFRNYARSIKKNYT